MIKAIAKKYCKENLVQLMDLSDSCNFIVSADEIILLKNKGKIIINKYENHPKRFEFPYSEKTTTGRYYNELFEYNKPYLNFKANFGGYHFDMDYFFEDNDRAIYYNNPLPLDHSVAEEKVVELSRTEIEAAFNKDAYDSMYVLDVNGSIIFANNQKDGLIVNRNIIPSDEEIVDLDLEDRISQQEMTKIAKQIIHIDDYSYDKELEEYPTLEPRPIDEIKDLKLYNSAMSDRCSHLLLTSKDGKFKLKWFKIVFVEKDKFKMTYCSVPIVLPTIDDIIFYSNNNNIEFTRDPASPYSVNSSDDKKETEEEEETLVFGKVEAEISIESDDPKLVRFFKRKQNKK